MHHPSRSASGTAYPRPGNRVQKQQINLNSQSGLDRLVFLHSSVEVKGGNQPFPLTTVGGLYVCTHSPGPWFHMSMRLMLAPCLPPCISSAHRGAVPKVVNAEALAAPHLTTQGIDASAQIREAGRIARALYESLFTGAKSGRLSASHQEYGHHSPCSPLDLHNTSYNNGSVLPASESTIDTIKDDQLKV